jgi:hypothetical protein
MSKIIFVPRTRQEIDEHPDKKIPIDELQEMWGDCHLWTLDFIGKFNLKNDHDPKAASQLYVMAGYGKVGSGVVFWGDETNWLSAETVAQRTAARFPDCTGVSIKIYSCHSSEGGYNSFVSRFARAFRPIGRTYEVTIFGYRGSVTTYPFALKQHEFDLSRLTRKFPKGYTGPKESVVVTGEQHRWSKINSILIQGRAKEFRDKVAWLKAKKEACGKDGGRKRVCRFARFNPKHH